MMIEFSISAQTNDRLKDGILTIEDIFDKKVKTFEKSFQMKIRDLNNAHISTESATNGIEGNDG